MRESEHVNAVQQQAIKLLSRMQDIKAASPAGRKLVKRARAQLLHVVENLGRLRTAETQHENRGA